MTDINARQCAGLRNGWDSLTVAYADLCTKVGWVNACYFVTSLSLYVHLTVVCQLRCSGKVSNHFGDDDMFSFQNNDTIGSCSHVHGLGYVQLCYICHVTASTSFPMAHYTV